MKKLISFICIAAVICISFCACGKAEPDEFVPIDEETVTTSAWAKGGTGEVGAEKGVEVAKIFNTLEVTGGVDEDADFDWSFVVISAGDVPTIHEFDFIGNDVFNVTVSKGETTSKFQVTSNELFNAIVTD